MSEEVCCTKLTSLNFFCRVSFSNVILPLLNLIIPEINFNKDVFPEPEGPIILVNFPFFIL